MQMCAYLVRPCFANAVGKQCVAPAAGTHVVLKLCMHA